MQQVQTLKIADLRLHISTKALAGEIENEK